MGPTAQAKKKLIAEGKLDKFGKPNDKTPKEYLRAVPDASAGAAKADAGADAKADKRERSPGADVSGDSPDKKKEKKDKKDKKDKKEKKDKKDKS